jgi:hypothetical protein
MAAPEIPVRVYPVSSLTFRYGNDDTAGLPTPKDLAANLAFTFDVRQGVLVLPPDGSGVPVMLTAKQIKPNTQFTEAAIMSLLQQVVNYFTSKNYMGVFVVPNTDQIDPRTGYASDSYLNNPNLEIVIWVNRVAQVRTINKGGRFAQGSAINNKAEAAIASHSPLLASSGNAQQNAAAKANMDVLMQNDIDDYLARLNRYPGRHVDAAVSNDGQTGKVNLDYIVTEGKPYTVYFEGSNTGTASTGIWNERIGVIDNQVTNYDDTFMADYQTTSLQGTSNSADISYERPIKYPDYIRARIYGDYSNYNSSNFAISSTMFTGQTWTGGGEFIFSPFQAWDGFAVDFTTGFKWENTRIDNQTLNQSQAVDFMLPYVGVSVDRQRFTNSTHADLTLIENVNHLSQSAMTNLGRLDTQSQAPQALFDASESFYLEPIFNPSDFKTGQNWSDSTLAEELSFRVAGQYTMDSKRVVPQDEYVAGGYYTVRGYPTSFVSGDTGWVGNAEYHLHLPRLLRPYVTADNPKATAPTGFKVRPPGVFGTPDWDLMLLGFFDVGQIYNNRAEINEIPSVTLYSAGGGVEMKVYDNLDLRVELGEALRGVNDPSAGLQVQAGHTQATFDGILSF